MSLRIGLSVTSLHAVEDPRLGAARILERVRAAREAGLASLFLGDHHATAQPYYQNVPMLGRALAEWDSDGDARTFGALFLLPLWHPLLLAEQVGTLAALGRGAFVLQCGLGAGDRQFAAFGVPLADRVRRFEASLRLLRGLFAGETVEDLQGPWPIQGARISPLPAAPVEIWIGASADAAIERAARLGDGWIADPAMDAEASAQRLAGYRAACAAAGRAPGRAVIRKDLLVAGSTAEATRRRAAVLERGYRGFSADSLVSGDAASVAEQLRVLETAGYDEVLLRCMESEQALALETIARLRDVRAQLA
jgi:alkanesulfonate monooxygenase SsuD/methylene tetrahydromethanopterin reductase-like flavin-dependent oxidoreductase (luciferase family)